MQRGSQPLGLQRCHSRFEDSLCSSPQAFFPDLLYSKTGERSGMWLQKTAENIQTVMPLEKKLFTPSIHVNILKMGVIGPPWVRSSSLNKYPR